MKTARKKRPPSWLPRVGLLRSGPCLVGRIGSGVQVSASFPKKNPCPVRQQKRYDLAGLSWGVLTFYVILQHVSYKVNFTSYRDIANNE